MTNLLEKALITGFGIFILTIFISMINPFIINISKFNDTINLDIEKCENFFFEVDSGIKFIIENPNATYTKNIDYPKNINITLTDFYCKYEYVIGNKIYYKIIEYTKPFIDHSYINLPANSYILRISNLYNFIEVQFN
ncbi:MAG: hypothetical protein HWN79_01715 [Candidatus Lokiarchaeota archaeon]|nr:hypothetical protein [Candidatus Lokiarchaeota archaeon]